MTSLIARLPRGLAVGLVPVSLFFLLLSPMDCRADEHDAAQKDNALLVYAGKLSQDHWYESFGPGTDFFDSNIAVVALSHTFHRAADLSHSYEIEAQIAQHSGLQDHNEFNLLAAYRWHHMPWSSRFNSSVAFGLGVSYATELPSVEVSRKGESDRLMAYWHLELALGPPKSDWQAMLRLHHRSPAFGLFGDEGGANALTLGVRYAFE
jgi:hypothetical protein